jgi:hypothetical protein
MCRTPRFSHVTNEAKDSLQRQHGAGEQCAISRRDGPDMHQYWRSQLSDRAISLVSSSAGMLGSFPAIWVEQRVGQGRCGDWIAEPMIFGRLEILVGPERTSLSLPAADSAPRP